MNDCLYWFWVPFTFDPHGVLQYSAQRPSLSQDNSLLFFSQRTIGIEVPSERERMSGGSVKKSAGYTYNPLFSLVKRKELIFGLSFPLGVTLENEEVVMAIFARSVRLLPFLFLTSEGKVVYVRRLSKIRSRRQPRLLHSNSRCNCCCPYSTRAII